MAEAQAARIVSHESKASHPLVELARWLVLLFDGLYVAFLIWVTNNMIRAQLTGTVPSWVQPPTVLDYLGMPIGTLLLLVVMWRLFRRRPYAWTTQLVALLLMVGMGMWSWGADQPPDQVRQQSQH